MSTPILVQGAALVRWWPRPSAGRSYGHLESSLERRFGFRPKVRVTDQDIEEGALTQGERVIAVSKPSHPAEPDRRGFAHSVGSGA
jgi:hypothetical protein